MMAVPSVDLTARVARTPASPCFCAASNVASGAFMKRAGFEPCQSRTANEVSEHVWPRFKVPASPLTSFALVIFFDSLTGLTRINIYT